MASRFWVGGSGNWSDNTNHWSASSGGSPGASLPTSADSVYFDANSFSGTGQTVTINATANCLDMDWTGASNNPTLAGSSGLACFGSFILNANMTVTYTGSISMDGTTTGNVINTNGKTLLSSFFRVAGLAGEWTLQSNINVTGSSGFAVNGGTLNTGNYNISCPVFNSNGASIRTINLGSSIVTVSAGNFSISGSNVTLNAGTSTIIMSGNNWTFAGGGATFNNLTCTGTPITITGSNTFNTLTVSAGKVLNLTAGTTQTITSLVSNGTAASKATMQSATSGSAATISKASGTLTVRNISLKDITATGGATFNALASTNVSGNTGWNFVTQVLVGQIKLSGTTMSLYWIDSTGTLQKISG